MPLRISFVDMTLEDMEKWLKDTIERADRIYWKNYFERLHRAAAPPHMVIMQGLDDYIHVTESENQMGTHLPIELTLDAFLNWLLENTQNATIADILEAVDESGQRAVELVNADPMIGPYFDELVFDKVYYYLRDKLGVFVSKSVESDTGVESYCASKVEGGKPCYYGDTEAQAIANWLRHEHPPV